jgi:uncharacterized protein (TIGR03382 family)
MASALGTAGMAAALGEGMRTTLAIGISLVAAGCSTELPVGERQSAVINGDLDNGDPAVVALMDGGSFFCTGTVISPRVVLTAAHCLEGGPPPDGIFFGTDSNNPGSGDIIAVKQARGHEQYDGQTADIAVIEMMQPTSVTPLPRNTTPLSQSMAGQDVRVVGFGLSVDNENSNEAGVKLTGTVTFDSIEADYMMVQPQGGQSGCYGDSGGPNFMTLGGQEVIAGVTSFGTENSCLAGLGGNTDVQKYKGWIDAFVTDVEGELVEPPVCQDDGVCEAGCTADPDCEGTEPGGDDDGGDGDDDGGSHGGAGTGGCSAGGTGGAGGMLLVGLALGLAATRRRHA